MSAPGEGLLRLALYLLPVGDDLTLLVLKGHLLIEEQLNERLKEVARKPDALNKVRLSFSALIQICRALFYGQNRAEEWFWSALVKLNRIRNDLAHRLETPKLIAELEEMLETLERDTLRVSTSSQPLPQRLRYALVFLHGVAEGMSPTASKFSGDTNTPPQSQD